ncbi:hypothetical protein TeGR_g15160 [Tetraparma gracilis]|uniref:Odorant receptor n=1 Tax=Tetraparma gracilis TaxID=2962635 RepID=A0ABQ6MU85_9STRA|nr:hypothetical protein TeGR_g15160 [Tetraparma gracilis]
MASPLRTREFTVGENMDRAQARIASEADHVEIDAMVRLNETGEFEHVKDRAGEANMRRKSLFKRGSSGGVQSFNSLNASMMSSVSVRIEDTVMDRKQRMSFKEVSNKEKMQVFRLAAVRRSMRYLEYAPILMADETIEVQHKFMEVGPNRASLYHIGYESLQGLAPGKSPVNTILDEMDSVSPMVRLAGQIRGYHWLGLLFATVCQLGECGLYLNAMLMNGEADIINSSALFASLVLVAFNFIQCKRTAFNVESFALSAELSEDDVRLKGMAFLRCRGMDLFHLAQKREAKENKKKKFISQSILEACTAHVLIGLVPTALSAGFGCYRNAKRGETLMSLLSFLSIGSRFTVACSMFEMAFYVRLNQRLSDFEIRRVEADIRTITPSMIHRITARFKSLLHECHQVGNASHKILASYGIIVINLLQLVGGVFLANFSSEAEEADADSVGGTVLVPAWTFGAVFQPLLSFLIFLHAYGNLNLAIERDVDQDIVEMNIRLTYSETHVPNWLLQQMICLERLDGRAFGLPLNLIPSVDMSRKLASNVIAAIVMLFPYLLSIQDKMSAELVVLSKYSILETED